MHLAGAPPTPQVRGGVGVVAYVLALTKDAPIPTPIGLRWRGATSHRHDPATRGGELCPTRRDPMVPPGLGQWSLCVALAW